MRFAIEELRNNRAALDYTAMLRNWLERTGRLHTPEPVQNAGTLAAHERS
jgi:hypothetical protein